MLYQREVGSKRVQNGIFGDFEPISAVSQSLQSKMNVIFGFSAKNYSKYEILSSDNFIDPNLCACVMYSAKK